MSIISQAKQQAQKERAAGAGSRRHANQGVKTTGPQMEEGSTIWLGEYDSTHEPHPVKLKGGDKQPMDSAEREFFRRTPYERGYKEYTYEGSIRLKDDPAKYADATDPRRGVREGSGILKYPSGEIYEGEWKNNRREGEGSLRTPVGYRYNGQFQDDVIHGKGYEVLPSAAAFSGIFEDGLPQGDGHLYFTADHNSKGYRYEGEFKDGLRHGKGTIFYPDGDVFSGTWDMGQRHGKSITTRPNGIQYISEWKENKLVGYPMTLDKNKRTKPPRSTANAKMMATVIPADLTKWTVKEDVEDLPLEHFQRIKLGFEKLDDNASGSLSTGELNAIWGKGSQSMLRKLDTDGNGTVELDEIFAAWYPRVPSYTISRYMQQDIHPRTLLRLRGMLAGRIHEHKQGYLQLVGVNTVDEIADYPLKLSQLQAAHFRIGGEKFTLAMFESAKIKCEEEDGPYFGEILETAYPNVPRSTLERYEMTEIPQDDYKAIREAFFKLSNNESYLQLDRFEEAQEAYRNRVYIKNVAKRKGETPELPPCANYLEETAGEGFFLWYPFWKMGSINLSVPLLKDVDQFDRKVEGMVTLSQILRFCFCNVTCKILQELLAFGGSTKSKSRTKCECFICNTDQGV